MLIEKKTGSIQNTEGITSSKWNIFPYLEVQKDLNLQVVIITQEVEARKGRDGVQPHPVRPPEYCCGWSVPPWWPRHVKLRDAAARGKRMMCSRAVEGLQTWAASVSKLFLGLFFDGPNNMTKLGLVGRDNGKQHEGDILVGAEGIRSKICRQKKTILSVEDVIALIGDRCDGVIGQLTEEWGETLFSALSRARGKAFSNMAVGYNNVDVNATNKYGVAAGNTPGVLTETTAELATSLALAATRRIVEADEFTRAGLYDGWLPNLFVGNLLKGQTVVVIGAARMGSVYARMMVEGFKMNLIYFDLFRATSLERFVTAYGESQKANGEQPVTWRRAGIWSKVRTNSFGPKDAIYSGYTCYTGITDFVPVDIEIVRYRDRVFLDNKQYCASSDVSAGKLQWYTFYEEPAGGVDKSNSKKERLLQIFGGWCDNVIDLLQDKEENAILRRDIYDRTASLTWEKGCVTLLSDSIHAMQLNMGHGGCMAIEDGYLWSLIAWKQSRESGSSVYEKAKRLQVNVLFFFLAPHLGDKVVV